MKIKLLITLLIISFFSGCTATMKLTSLGEKREWASNYDEAYVSADKSLYLSYMMQGDDPGKRRIEVKLYEGKTKDPRKITSFPNQNDLQKVEIIENSGVDNNTTYNCPLIIKYYSFGSKKYKYNECTSSHQTLIDLPLPPSRGSYTAWWSTPVIIIGLVPAVIFDIITFPFIAPQVLNGAISH